YTGLSNSEGKINFYTKNFYAGNEIIAQTDPRTDSLSNIEITFPFSSKFTDIPKADFTRKPESLDLLKRSIAMQVNNAYHSKHLNSEKSPAWDSLYFYLRPDKVYQLDNYVRFTTMEEVLREYVPEITVSLRRKD